MKDKNQCVSTKVPIINAEEVGEECIISFIFSIGLLMYEHALDIFVGKCSWKLCGKFCVFV